MLVKRKEEFELYQEQTIIQPAGLPKAKVNRSLRAKCLILVVLFAVMAMFTTVRNGMAVGAGYDLVKIKSETAKLEVENERLKLEISQMKAPQRIQEIAAAKLGMIVPPEVYFATKSGS